MSCPFSNRVCIDNQIGAEGAQALGEGLKENTALTTLGLSGT